VNLNDGATKLINAFQFVWDVRGIRASGVTIIARALLPAEVQPRWGSLEVKTPYVSELSGTPVRRARRFSSEAAFIVPKLDRRSPIV